MLPSLFSPAPGALERLGREVMLALLARCVAVGGALALLALLTRGYF